MKRSVLSVDQRGAIEAGLDLREIVFLDWFTKWASTGKMDHHEHEGRIYWWISRQKVIDDLPILGLSSTSKVSTFITRLIDKGMLDRVTVTNKARRGRRSYVRTTDKWVDLWNDHVPKSEREKRDHVPKSERKKPRPRSEIGTSDIPTRRDTPTKDSGSTDVSPGRLRASDQIPCPF
mgnify:CR=1 FL=1